jgi:exopolysaccharide biosynthesis polyprenyl glycosylphosphotransferase
MDGTLRPGPRYRSGEVLTIPRVLGSRPEWLDIATSKRYDLSKRVLDIIISTFFLILTFPIFAFAALAIWSTSPGPIFFRQRRMGLDGREFWCLKFRTMVVNAEQVLKERADLQAAFAADFKLKHDPRITSIGNLLRKTSLDELPQLWNVLRGEMSLVGPRPIVPSELEKYGPYGDNLLTVKPGLSGLWQVSGRNDTTYEERVQLDMQYIELRSLTLDLFVLLRTASVVVRGSGAY